VDDPAFINPITAVQEQVDVAKQQANLQEKV
jgi:hypothetical protein